MDDLIARIRAELDETGRIASLALRYRKDYLERGLFETWVAKRDINNETPPYYDYWAVEAHLGDLKPQLVVRFDGLPGVVELDARFFAASGAPTVLRQVAAHRKILELHAAYDEAYPEWADADIPNRRCIGCGFDGSEDAMVDDVNNCPTLLALAEGYGIEVVERG